MGRCIFNLLFIFLTLNVTAQQKSESDIRNSGSYYFGAGTSKDENQAHEEAIASLCEMIAVNVSSRFELNATEENFNYQEKATSVVKTYATGTLREVESIRTVLPDGKVRIFCYMAKSEVNKIFSERIALVRSLIKNADRNRESGNLAMALKNYYFGLILLKSVPEERLGAENHDLTTDLPQSINEILNQVKFSFVSDYKISERERHIELSVTYNGKPVSSLHFKYWDGSQLSATSQVRDGRADIILYGASTDLGNLKIDIQYEYYNARREYLAVENLWNLVSLPEFKAQQTIYLKKDDVISGTAPVIKPAKFESNEVIPVEANITKNTEVFLQILKTGSDDDLLTTFGNDDFLKNKIATYRQFNKPLPLNTDVKAEINSTRSGYEVRKIPVVHNYSSLHKQSNEYLVLDFDREGYLRDFNLCITNDLYDKFVNQATFGNDWGNRQEIIKFVEKYRTAYFTRDIQTIDLMFADEALILIGRKIQPKKQNVEDIGYKPLPGQPDFEQIQLTKQAYLTRQKQIFDNQKDIFIDFSTFEIMKKNNAPGVYGVEMRQNYSSTTYADEGYLFLLIDFREEDPLIYIRAWQPNEWDTNALINTSNFRIYK